MKLERTERLLLANQYKILAALNTSEADFYNRAAEVMENGYELLYDWYSQHIVSETLDEHECREVLDILSMFDDLMYSRDQLDDKSGIDESLVEFPGFDGNHETRQLGLVAFLINEEGKFQRLKDCGDSLNSHAPLLGAFRRMLPLWQSYKREVPLPKDAIIKISSEMVHPSRRSL